MDLHLKDKIALVTGSTRGLGYATALQLAKEGCKVAINGRDETTIKKAAEQIQKETGAQVIGLAGDASLPDVPAQLVQQTVDAFSGLDILITNTGGPKPGSIDSLDEAAWQSGIDLCLMAHVRLIKSALPHLRKSQAASILTVTSLTVKQPLPNLLISNSVRTATVGLTKSLAIELGAEGIRVNSILPGWTETERVTALMEDRANKNQSSAEEEAKRQAAEIPLGRMGQPAEFANAAVFLVSPAASYITGTMLNVDGSVIKGIF
ncbi:MAG: SDR family oxidoreductase [Anaerolineales bacterium]|nr:SDR family oxidoreductase [Anaerolineales bacterium]MCB9145261.1 SDR family oxidoreductase [Anaerolineales bacterium]